MLQSTNSKRASPVAVVMGRATAATYVPDIFSTDGERRREAQGKEGG
jgi:hypothetical protein